ncbi:MAG: hypothetical protein FJ206_02840 [Gemmatimonadetes bacterium]|nr:hypothetical protein [Gemmatimonadota bacterium]
MATHVVVRSEREARFWASSRVFAMLATVALLGALVVWPGNALAVLWYGAIPLLPATFFLSPIPWRSVCPLATLNEWGNLIGRQRAPTAREVAWLTGLGLVLFHLMVPARRFLFNEHGLVLAVTVAAVGLLAVGLGVVYSVRSGFCNDLCPVLPVELLYGQAPVVRLRRGRCETCTTCTPRGCIDLSQGRAFTQVTGTGREWQWLTKPFGLFIAALPGFIIGYSTLPNGPIDQAFVVYGTTLGWSLASLVVVAGITIVGRVEARLVPIGIAATAGVLYYWFTGPVVARELAVAPVIGEVVRWIGMAVVASWLFVTLRARFGARSNPAEIG